MTHKTLFLAGLSLALGAGLSARNLDPQGAPQLRLENPDYQVEGVIASDIRFDFPRPVLESLQENGRSWTRVSIEGCSILDRPGAPDLPSRSTLVEIPDRSGVRFELVDAEYEILPLDAPVYPQQERVVDAELGLPMDFIQDEAAYAAPVFPAENFASGEPALLRNTRVVQLSTFPVQVVEGGQALKVCTSMVIRPVFEGTDLRNARTYTIGSESSPMNRAVAPLVVNHAANAETAGREIFEQTPEPGNYLVVARNSTITNESYFQQWVDWKREKGHRVTVIGEAETGSWTNTAIRNYVINAYQNWEHTPDYLVLFGDTGSTGAYQLPGGAGSSYSGEQDHFYAKLEGNDILGDIAVGRISVTNSSQLSNVLNKVMLYERDIAGDTSWLGRAALGTGWQAVSMEQQSRTIASDLVNDHGFTQIDTAWIEDMSSTWVEQRFNSGIGFYNYRGWIGMQGVNTSFVDSHFSNVGRPVVTVIFTCATGDFHGGYSTTEAFLRNGSVPQPKGGVCALGFSTASTHTAYNNAVVGGFWNGALEHTFPEVGVSLFMGKYTLYATMPPGNSNPENFANWANLMGDPGMYLWLGDPATVSVTHDGSLTDGQSHLPVSVSSGGSPLADAVVTLYQSSTGAWTRVMTDAAGEALALVDGFSAGSVKLTVSKQNHRVYQSTLSLGSANAWAEVADPGIAGGEAIPGQLLTLNPVLQNTGTSTALTSLSATASLDAAYGSLSDNSASWPNVSAGGSAAASGSLALTLDADLPVGTVVPLELSISSGQGSFEDIVELLVVAPGVVVTNMSFSPGGSVIQPGVTATMTLTLSNNGTLDAGSLACALSGSDPLLAVVDGNDVSGSYPEGGTTTVSFVIDADNGSFGGYQAALELDWTADGQILGSLPLVVPVGTEVAISPTGPDAYGYRAYEDTDSNTESPVYNWIELAPAAGGSGTLVPLSDTSDEGDDAHLVTLPFTFRFYGIDYDQMGICSNGFVGMGPLGHIETDFRNHPFPTGLGPDAMIAPMWDDMWVGSGANVYTQYFPADHIYVVEWYNMRHNNTSGRNTFQLILYDPAHYPTATGDGEFVFQYQNFENTQSHSYDFPYCSIGIKDHTSTVGLTLSNYNIEPASIAGINDNKAIRFTTDLGVYSDEDLVPPTILHTPPAVSYAGSAIPITANVSDNHAVAQVLLFYDDGSGYVQQAMSNTSGDTWTGSIPDQAGGGTVMYYIEATDAAEESNTTTTPTYTLTIYDVLFTEDFDGGHAFTHESIAGGVDQWHQENYRSNSAPNSFKFGGTGSADYASNADGWLTTPLIPLGDNATDMQFSFWSWVDGENSGFYPDSCYDGGVVEVLLDGGAWEPAVLNPDYTHALRAEAADTVPFDYPRQMISGAAEWSLYAIEIPDGTESLQVRFGFASDGGVTREGWYLDDMLLTGIAPIEQEPIEDLTITVVGPTVVLNWSAVPFASSYNIYRSNSAYDFSAPPVAVSATNLWVGATEGSSMYFYRVEAVFE